MFKHFFHSRSVCSLNNFHQSNISRLIHYNSLHTISRLTPRSSKLLIIRPIIGKAQLSSSSSITTTKSRTTPPKMALTVQSCSQLPTGKLPEYIKSSKADYITLYGCHHLHQRIYTLPKSLVMLVFEKQ